MTAAQWTSRISFLCYCLDVPWSRCILKNPILFAGHQGGVKAFSEHDWEGLGPTSCLDLRPLPSGSFSTKYINHASPQLGWFDVT